jgi:tryptophanyl-tRNA synthetase
MVTSVHLPQRIKEKLKKIKEQTRSASYGDAVNLLCSLYQQVAAAFKSRGEELEFAESIEQGKALSYLLKKLSGKEAAENVEKVEERKNEEKKNIKIKL